MAEKSGKHGLEGMKEELRAPSPGHHAPRRGIPHFPRRNLSMIMALIVVALVVSGIAFVGISKIREKRALEKKLFEFEKSINQTDIQNTRDMIQDLIKTGVTPIAKQELLSQSNDYICSITTDKGTITLRKRGSLMKESIMRSGYNLSVVFLDDKMYMYHPIYNVWAMFPYDSGKATSADSNTYSAFSMAEINGMNATQFTCIKTQLPKDEFELGDTKVVDALAFLKGLNFR